MAGFYCKVLENMAVNALVVGRGEAHCDDLRNNTNLDVLSGGIMEQFPKLGYIPTHAIVSTGVETLVEVTSFLIQNGVQEILLEKPGALNRDGLLVIDRLANEHNANVWIAYNRRYYSSVMEAERIIEADGGVKSLNYEFTELASSVESATSAPIVKNNWFLANSTHVVDLAFYLGGVPTKLSSYTKDNMSWYNKAAILAGAGITDKNALFSYIANWKAPGRWGIEICTNAHRLFLKPMEKLSIQELNSFEVKEYKIDDPIDLTYKPGLYRQVDDFLSNRSTPRRLKLDEHIKHVSIYEKFENGNA